MIEQIPAFNNKVVLVEEYDEYDWFQLELQNPYYFNVEDGKEFLRSN